MSLTTGQPGLTDHHAGRHLQPPFATLCQLHLLASSNLSAAAMCCIWMRQHSGTLLTGVSKRMSLCRHHWPAAYIFSLA
jgi:hypothetical protein